MSDRLRIALLGSSSFPIAEPFAGGMEAHISQLARALTARGHAVTLFASEGSVVNDDTELLTVARLDLSPVALESIPIPVEAMSEHHAYLAVMLDLAGALRDEFDIIHNHSLHYLPIALSRTLQAPMLTTLHTPPTAWLESAAALSDRDSVDYVAVSGYAASQWAPIVGDVDVVFNGIGLDRWPVGPGGEGAVWSGRIVPEKAPHLAIDAARAAGIPLTLAGPISNVDYYEQEVAPRLGVGARYAGHLRHQELSALVGSSSVALVTPVWEEPYGLVVAEALACGTPVAAFDRGGISEILDRSSGRLAAPDNTRELAGAILEAAALPRASARARAEAVCSETRMVGQYLDRYRTMLRGRAISAVSEVA